MFTDGNPRHQRAGSLGFPYFDPYNENYSLGASSHSLLNDVSIDDDTTWALFNSTQSPQCIGQDQTAPGAIRTPHDDLCAHPPKCPTASHFGGSGGHNPSHMLFHTRHFDPQAMSSSALHQQPASGPPQASMLGSLVDYDSGTFFPQTTASTSGPSTSIFSSEDFGEQLSALSSPPTRNSAREGEEDRESVCDSDCDFGTICHDTVCSEDPSACCEDESCWQTSLSPHDDAITSEDAIAAAALAAIGEQQRMAATTGAASASILTSSLHAGHHDHSHSMSAASAVPCLPFGAGPDLCISPQFLMNFRHLQEVHNPLHPSICTEPACPAEDPSFYQECHVRHFTHNTNHGPGGGMFDNIDLDMMMSEHATHDHRNAVECGARFPDSHSMFEHMLNEHGTSLSIFQNPAMQHSLGLGQTFATATPASPFVNMVQQGVADSSSYSDQLSLSRPLRYSETARTHAHNSPQTAPAVVSVMEGNETMKDGFFKVEPTQVNASVSSGTAEHVNAGPEGRHECLWCSYSGGEPCKQVFDSAGGLHRHVLDAHTHQLKRGANGMFSCGWQGCTRCEGEGKNGFLQKSKVDRHMQVHTGSKRVAPSLLESFTIC